MAEALADFDRIYDFLAESSPTAAARLLRKLDAAINRLADQPRLGRPYRLRRRRLRVLTHGEYRVFYQERPRTIWLVRVLHGRQDIPDILEEL